jgi:hypothetical protein
MKFLGSMLILVVTVLSLSACNQAHKGHPHHGDFCPPGQAKKGNC